MNSKSYIDEAHNDVTITATHTIEDFEEITIQNGQILVNKKFGDPMKPLDHHIYPNRHERRKAQAIRRRELRKGLYGW